MSYKMKEKPVLFKEKKECCGCAVCYNICPKDAIEMIADEEGFFYPIINENKCIRCYMCERVCFLRNTEKNDF